MDRSFKDHLKALSAICEETGEPMCTDDDAPDSEAKEANLFDLGKQANLILEIGFGAGRSALLFLLANTDSRLIIFDICYYKYTIPCFEYLQEQFPERLLLITGDSNQTIPRFFVHNQHIKFDLIHIDGGRERTVAFKDFASTYLMATDLVVFNDTHKDDLNELFESFLKKQLLQEILLRPTQQSQHRIARVPTSKVFS